MGRKHILMFNFLWRYQEIVYFCTKTNRMIDIKYQNAELESLFTRGKSATFKTIMNKKLFMQALYSFKTLLNIINNVVELKIYSYLHYKHNATFSTVTVEGAGLNGDLVFLEEEQGRRVTIYDLIIK